MKLIFSRIWLLVVILTATLAQASWAGQWVLDRYEYEKYDEVKSLHVGPLGKTYTHKKYYVNDGKPPSWIMATIPRYGNPHSSHVRSKGQLLISNA